MEKLEWESLQNMDAKLLSLNENVQAKIETVGKQFEPRVESWQNVLW